MTSCLARYVLDFQLVVEELQACMSQHSCACAAWNKADGSQAVLNPLPDVPDTSGACDAGSGIVERKAQQGQAG